MKQHITFVFLLSIILSGLQAQGLQFKGNRSLIDERTSYEVFHGLTPTFKDSLAISFDFFAENTLQTGYIFRVKTQDPDLTFNLNYNSQGNTAVFKLNREGESSLVTHTIEKTKLGKSKWLNIRLYFNLLQDSISFSIEDQTGSCKIKDLPTNLQTQVFFGRSDYYIDVPAFSIRNVVLNDGNIKYTFPLKESQGTTVHDNNWKVVGLVDNPTWLINESYYWKQIASYRSRSVAGFNFDSLQQKIYYFNRDSLTTFNLANKETQVSTYSEESPIHPRLGSSFINTGNNSLYLYEVSTPLAGDVTMAAYNLTKKTWSTVSKDVLTKQMHHHGRFFDEANNRFIIFEGFGHLYYNNEFNSFNLETNRWEKLSFTGDAISPRYFLSMGHDKQTNTLYIFGGMGNESGEYNVGRKYYYDFYKVDLNTQHITKLWEIPWKEDYVVPVRSMIIDKDHFTTLCYPEHFTASHLRLYQFSIKDGTYKILGDSIPIRSEKITTNADLLYSKYTNEMYGVVQEFEDDDIASALKIYTIAVPAVSQEELILPTELNAKNDSILSDKAMVILALIICCILIVFIRIKRKREKKLSINAITNKHETIAKGTEDRESINAIYLFGDFTVYDKKGKDISYMFSNRLRQAFILILQESHKEGISSQQLTESLWSDRDDDKAKNIRGVTINSLRKILDEMDDIQLIHNDSCFKLIIGAPIYCDYIHCYTLLAQNSVDEVQIALIAQRGKFLKNEADPIFDTIKSDIEFRIEPIIRSLAEKQYAMKNYRTSLSLAEIIFNIDPINEFALSIAINSMTGLDMENKARRRFSKFTSEYESMIGEVYPKDFSTIISSK